MDNACNHWRTMLIYIQSNWHFLLIKNKLYHDKNTNFIMKNNKNSQESTWKHIRAFFILF